MQAPASHVPINVFLADDHKCILWGLEKLVNGEQPGMRVVGTAHTRADALAGIRRLEPDVVLLDLDLGGENSLEFLPEILQQQPRLRVVILTGCRDKAMLERAVAAGASGIVLKDEPADILLTAIRRVHRGELWIDRALLARVLGAFVGGTRPDAGTRTVDPLTLKERQIIQAIVEQRGANSNVVAAKLFMSGHTLRNHLTTIYRKLEVRNRLELVMYAIEHRLAPPAPDEHKRKPAMAR